jgi:(R)-amidase
MSVRIAVAQQESLAGQVERNRDKALRYAEQGLQQGADIVLFHEELLVGYVENLCELAEPVNGPTTQAFQRLLKGSDARILYGLTEREGEHCYIAATLVGPESVVANYRKTHLWWKAEGLRHEPSFYLPGDRLVTFEVKGHKSGVMICYDGDFPEMTRSYANLDCTMLFWMNNRKSRGYEEVKALASRNSMIMATSCCCGKNERGEVCRGGSNITDARGQLITEIWDSEGVILADVQPEKVLALRQQNPWYRGQRRDLYC